MRFNVMVESHSYLCSYCLCHSFFFCIGVFCCIPTLSLTVYSVCIDNFLPLAKDLPPSRIDMQEEKGEWSPPSSREGYASLMKTSSNRVPIRDVGKGKRQAAFQKVTHNQLGG